MKTITTLSTLLALSMACTVHAEEWGTVKGKFVYDGKAPAAAKIVPTKDVEVCGAKPLFVEELVVNPENNGLANLVVTLYLKRGEKVDVHPDYAADEAGKVVIDNIGCRFEPHILLLRTTQTLVVGNKDAVSHNASFVTIKNQPKNNIIPAFGSVEQSFPEVETLPATIRCDVHPWMGGRAVIKDHPYMAATDADGNFELKNLPAGKHTLQLWHEKCGYVDKAKQGTKNVKWSRGRMEITVKAGDNDLGEFALNEVFKK